MIFNTVGIGLKRDSTTEIYVRAIADTEERRRQHGYEISANEQ